MSFDRKKNDVHINMRPLSRGKKAMKLNEEEVFINMRPSTRSKSNTKTKILNYLHNKKNINLDEEEVHINMSPSNQNILKSKDKISKVTHLRTGKNTDEKEVHINMRLSGRSKDKNIDEKEVSTNIPSESKVQKSIKDKVHINMKPFKISKFNAKKRIRKFSVKRNTKISEKEEEEESIPSSLENSINNIPYNSDIYEILCDENKIIKKDLYLDEIYFESFIVQVSEFVNINKSKNYNSLTLNLMKNIFDKIEKIKIYFIFSKNIDEWNMQKFSINESLISNYRTRKNFRTSGKLAKYIAKNLSLDKYKNFLQILGFFPHSALNDIYLYFSILSTLPKAFIILLNQRLLFSTTQPDDKNALLSILGLIQNYFILNLRFKGYNYLKFKYTI